MYAVKTKRRGAHHLVEAVLVGPDGVEHTKMLMVDTGASAIVLPSSMIDRLGFQLDALKRGRSQTANGKVPIRRGTLWQVRIGDAEVDDVAVNFIADDKFGDRGLLGMSFLKHFRMTIDDDTNQLTLLPK